MAHGLLSQERYREAASVFRIMLQVIPTDERGWLGLAECHEHAGHDELALDIYSAGTVAVKDAARCQLGRARLLRATDRTDESDEAFDLAASIAMLTSDDETAVLVERERSLKP
jgi:thioredoxin-like negative regulator of GroEL